MVATSGGPVCAEGESLFRIEFALPKGRTLDVGRPWPVAHSPTVPDARSTWNGTRMGIRIGLSLLCAFATASASAQIPPCQIDFDQDVIADDPATANVVRSGDLNGDGLVDFIVTRPGRLLIYFNNGGERLEFVDATGPFYASSLGDIDGDGDLDLVGRMSNSAAIRRNDGTGTFLAAEFVATPDGSVRGALVGDVDLDGDLDLIVRRVVGFVIPGPIPPSHVGVYTNDGTGSFTFVDEILLPSANSGLWVEDVTGDGVVDIVALHHETTNPYYTITPILIGGMLSSTQVFQIPSMTGLAVGDIDNDAPADLLITRVDAPPLVRLGSGAEIEATGAGIPIAFQPAVGDVDGDGFGDLVTGDTATGAAGVQVHLNLGGTGFAPPKVFGPRAPSPHVVDLDGDGFAEIVTPNTVWWNRTLDFDDCDGNGIADGCELGSDCNGNGVLDDCDILAGTESDLDGDGVPDSCQRFVRGDVNGDGEVDLADVIRALSFLFLEEPGTSCLDAADIDDGGIVDISDTVGLLSFLFSGGPSPAPPFPDCGVDPSTDTGLDCVAQPACQ